MAVICAACQTENRDAAMFCHGCARKLPTFKPTAPSLLETLRARDAAEAARPSSKAKSVMKRAVREPLFPLGVALLVAALTVGWYAKTTREPPKAAPVASAMSPPGAPGPTVVASASVMPAAAALAPAKPGPLKPAEPAPVPLVASLAPGEIELSPGRTFAPVAPAGPAAPVAAAAPTAPERRAPPRAVTPPRQVALDPRRGCETLNFVFADRCAAAHCDKPEYAHHPRCNLVREERRRDEARRNPTLGF